MKVCAIAAVAENYVIGRDQDLPWRLPADLRWFVKHTRGKPVVFGRRTYDSTGHLPGRRNIVVTRQPDYESDCDAVADSVAGALALAGDVDEVMILGGATIYEALMPTIDRLYLTVVHARPDGDTRFPPIDDTQWDVTLEEFRAADDKNSLDMTFFVLDRAVYAPVERTSALLPARFLREP